MTEDQIKHMVSRFLGWRLPETFNHDGGIKFENLYSNPIMRKNECPSGSNLLDADQAAVMVRYIVDGLPVNG